VFHFTIVASVAIGMACSPMRTVVWAMAILVASDAGSAVLPHHDPAWTVSQRHQLQYLCNTIVLWAVARELRGAGGLDTTCVEAVARAGGLA